MQNATIIKIDLKDGGISEIKIIDNGHGIEHDDIEKTIIPHATSKLESYSDLEDVFTMGFRGEALSSIAEISDITILTMHKNNDIGIELSKIATASTTPTIKHKATQEGTCITISHLFKNVPVRFKFLKQPSTECNAITKKCVQQLSLHYPNIAFSLSNNSIDILSTNGKTT